VLGGVAAGVAAGVGTAEVSALGVTAGLGGGYSGDMIMTSDSVSSRMVRCALALAAGPGVFFFRMIELSGLGLRLALTGPGMVLLSGIGWILLEGMDSAMICPYKPKSADSCAWMACTRDTMRHLPSTIRGE